MSRKNRSLRSPPPRPAQDDSTDPFIIAAGTITNNLTPTQIQGKTASTTNRNRALDDDVYGGRKITYTNRYDKLRQLPKVNGRAGLGLIKLGLKGAKGYRLVVDKKIVPDLKRQAELLAPCNKLSQTLNGDKLFFAAMRLFARDGDVAPLTTGEDGVGITAVEFLPMDRTTFLPDSVEPGAGLKDKEQLKDVGVIQGPVTRVVLNENLGKEGWSIYDIERVAVIRLAEEGNEVLDIYGRPTLGIYGQSLLELLDPTIKKLEDMTWGFAKAIGRYGYGRTIYNDRLLEEMVKEGKITRKAAGKINAASTAQLKRMGPDEDVVGIGMEAQGLGPNIASDGGILNMKEAFERDISYGLLETEASSNKASGTTFASSYTAAEDADLIMDIMRLQVKRAFETGIFARHLVLLGIPVEEATAIRIELDPIRKQKYTLQELNDLRAMFPNIMTDEQMLELLDIQLPAAEEDATEDKAPDEEPQKPMMPTQEPVT